MRKQKVLFLCTQNSALGHASIVQTMGTYSHLLDDVDDNEIGGLDKAFG